MSESKAAGLRPGRHRIEEGKKRVATGICMTGEVWNRYVELTKINGVHPHRKIEEFVKGYIKECEGRPLDRINLGRLIEQKRREFEEAKAELDKYHHILYEDNVVKFRFENEVYDKAISTCVDHILYPRNAYGDLVCPAPQQQMSKAIDKMAEQLEAEFNIPRATVAFDISEGMQLDREALMSRKVQSTGVKSNSVSKNTNPTEDRSTGNDHPVAGQSDGNGGV